jgi:hypothetical protein
VKTTVTAAAANVFEDQRAKGREKKKPRVCEAVWNLRFMVVTGSPSKDIQTSCLSLII